MNYNVKAMYFSPTGTTGKVVKKLSEEISRHVNENDSIKYINFTSHTERMKPVKFYEDDIVIFGVPVYAGRVPNILLKYLRSIKSRGSLAVAVVVYGNRNYDDALIELKDLLELSGFKVVAACAFIGEHSFSELLAKGRPDKSDLHIAESFANKIFNRIKDNAVAGNLTISGNKPYRPYYRPKDKNGNYVDFRKITPKTNSNCIDCKICSKICPMNSISFEDVSIIHGICIKCGACIKKCPVHAKYYDDENYLLHKHELESEFSTRNEPDLFI